MPPTPFPPAASLSPADLDRVLAEFLHVRAARRAPGIAADEAALLARVNAGPPPEVWAEYRALQAAAGAGTLTPADHADLIGLTDQIEAYQADRAAALAALAAARGQTLAELAAALDLGPPPAVPAH